MEMEPAPSSRPAAGLLTIRDAQASEHDQVAELVTSAYEEYRPFVSPEFVAEFRRDTREVFADHHTEVIVAESQGRLVGTITFYPDGTKYGGGLPPGWTSMRILAIAPDWRRRGVGSLGFRRAPELDVPYTPEVTVIAYILDL
jgi:predicted N-acetyltransferase YhbS